MSMSVYRSDVVVVIHQLGLIRKELQGTVAFRRVPNLHGAYVSPAGHLGPVGYGSSVKIHVNDGSVDSRREQSAIMFPVLDESSSRRMASQPAKFIQDLARQTQLLACLKWLSDLQVLACIPVADKITFTDAAELAGVPARELCRVIRMTATFNFLSEPEPGYVAHSALSAQFVTNPSLLDAGMFLCETITPSALRMADATLLRKDPKKAQISAYELETPSAISFAAHCESYPKLRRRLTAFKRIEEDVLDEDIADALSSLDWRSLGVAKVVEVGARSNTVAVALCSREPSIHFIIQTRENSVREKCQDGSTCKSDALSRITIQHRAAGVPQSVHDAAVYILHMPTPSLSTPSASLSSQITAMLKAHFNVLRANSTATLVITARLLPEPGTMEADVEASMRMQDLWLLQMTNDEAWEISHLLKLLDGVRDGNGRLAVVNRLSSRHHPVVALQVQIQPLLDAR